MKKIDLYAIKLRDCWAVRPKNKLGTCGWLNNGEFWEIVYIRRARDGEEAINKAFKIIQNNNNLCLR